MHGLETVPDQLYGILLFRRFHPLDLNIGATGSADNVDMLWNVQGDTNIFDVDIGGNYAADNLNMDLTILGDRNDFRSAVSNQKHGVVLGSDWNNTVFSQSGVKVDACSQLGK